MRSLTLLMAALTCLSACQTEVGAEAGQEGSGSSETDAAECNGFEDSTDDTQLELRVVNQRAEPVYLLTRGDCTFHHVHIENDSGHWPAGACDLTCEQYQAGTCTCAGACPEAQPLRIEAGGTYVLPWNYWLFADNIPASCSDPECGGGACWVRAPVPDDSFTISTSLSYGFEQCAGPEDPCACGGGQDACMIDLFEEGVLPDASASAEFELPSEGPIVLSIE